MTLVMSDAGREFAVDVVRRLTKAGYLAYWAGGCVRDLLMGREPSDYDVATTATPEEVRQLFGHRQTVAVGASFGVIIVVGPRLKEEDNKPLQVEVATFRREGEYTDGRRPDRVEYCTPEEDAHRRDFTINAMFYDPLSQQVHDYVGGKLDLERNVIRAVGIPSKRMEEDKLRLLRAVRFTSRFGFTLEEQTEQAIRTMSAQILVVSWERIADEFRKMLKEGSRSRAMALAAELGLLAHILPELVSTIENETAFESLLAQLAGLKIGSFELSMAILLEPLFSGNERKLSVNVEAICRRMKLSNDETERIGWLIKERASLIGASSLPLHRLKTLLVHPDADLLLEWTRVRESLGAGKEESYALCQQYLEQHSQKDLNPPAILSGADLISMGMKPGKDFAILLNEVRRLQLDEEISSTDEAKAWVEAQQSKK